MARINGEAPVKVLDGYAPFCKLHVHRNWNLTHCLTVPISDDNRHLQPHDSLGATQDRAARVDLSTARPTHPTMQLTSP